MTTAADPASLRAALAAQHAMAWKLLALHLDTLDTDACLWRPTPHALHVARDAAGKWHADWPDREDYGLGPASLAWHTWHCGFWWSMALDHAFGKGTLTREKVTWPGTADGVRFWLGALHDDWAAQVANLPDDQLASDQRTRWPFTGRPFAQLLAWANLELMKSAADIGAARFLHAARGAIMP